MSIIVTLKCDDCGNLEKPHPVNIDAVGISRAYEIAQRNASPVGNYKHLCDDCFFKLENFALHDKNTEVAA